MFLAFAVAAAALTGFYLLGTTSAYGPWLRWLVLAGGLLAAAGVGMGRFLRSPIAQRTTAALAIAASLGGPLAYSVTTAATAHSGAIVSAGPASGFGGGGRGGAGARGPGNFGAGNRNTFGRGTAQGSTGQGSTGQGFTGQGFQQQGSPRGTTQGGAGFAGAAGGGMGGLLGAPTPSADLVAALKKDASHYTWAAAVVGSNNAAGYQLATELPVMAVGGFNGTDPSPTLAQFQELVSQGKIHYFIAGGTMRSTSGSDAAAQIAQWVSENFTPQSIGGATVYTLAG